MRAYLLPMSALVILTACQTVPDEVESRVDIAPPQFETCTQISALTRVEIPAVTRKFTTITEIDNGEYEPLQETQTHIREIEPARVIFVNSEGKEVTDICDTEINPSGMTNDGSL